MFETLGLISSVIGIGIAIWAFIKFLFKPYWEIKKIVKMIDVKSKEWQEHPWFSGGRTLIQYDDFRLVKKHKKRLKNLDNERLAFLLRNAIQHGKMVGDWGYWFVRNKDNDDAIFAILTAIGELDWKPAWRAAYCIESACGRNVEGIFEKLPDMSPEIKERVKTVFEVISSKGVIEYLKTATDDEGKQRKPQLVLEEIEMFRKDINEYTRRRQQRQIIKSLTSD